MSEFPTLDVVDQDGAIREAAEAAGVDRRNFLRSGAVAGGGIVAGSALFGMLDPAEAAISSRRSKKNDVKILNFALTLEYLEAEFYTRAQRNNAAGGDKQLARFNQIVARHERQHVQFLRGALGKAAVKKPSFDFRNTVKNRAAFAATAQVLEDTGVRAYLGQAGNIKQVAVLGAAGSILTVEARHAGWIRFINSNGTGGANDLPAPGTFDKPASEKKILRAVKGTGFIQG